MTLYAYYKPGEREETLESHIRRGINFINKIYLKYDYHIQISNKFEIPPKDAAKIIITTYALHDVGKAYNPYQSLIKGGRGAPGHEVLSAYHAKKILDLDLEIIKAVALAIIMHHHAMREISDAFATFLKYGNKYHIEDEEAKNLESLLKGINIELSLDRKLESKNLVTDLFNLLKNILRVPENASKQYALAYYLLHPLITCDILAASTSNVNLSDLSLLKRILIRLPPWVKDFIESRLSNPFIGYNFLIDC